MAPSLDALLAESDHLVIAQKPSAEAQARILASHLPRVDLVHAF